MRDNKAAKLWIVNILSFFLFSILTFTGLISWLLLPRGYRGGGNGILISLRHFLREVHQWAALLFIFIVLVHLVLHWPYIKSNLNKHGILK